MAGQLEKSGREGAGDVLVAETEGVQPALSLSLPAILDVTQAQAWHEKVQEWISGQPENVSPRLVLADVENVISLQLAVAVWRTAQTRGSELLIEGPDGAFPALLDLDAPMEAAS